VTPEFTRRINPWTNAVRMPVEYPSAFDITVPVLSVSVPPLKAMPRIDILGKQANLNPDYVRDVARATAHSVAEQLAPAIAQAIFASIKMAMEEKQ
jgi:hypothetical protein